jgi:hypothetical protein
MHRDREFAKWYRKDGSDCVPLQAQLVWNAAWEAAIRAIQDAAVERLMAGQQSRQVTVAEVRSAIR